MPETLDFEGFTQLFLPAWTESLQSEVRITEGPEQDGARDADGRRNGDDRVGARDSGRGGGRDGGRGGYGGGRDRDRDGGRGGRDGDRGRQGGDYRR